MFNTHGKPTCILVYLVKCNTDCNQCFTRFIKNKKSPKECKTAEMIPITTATQSNLNVMILKALEEEDIDDCSCQKFMK